RPGSLLALFSDGLPETMDGDGRAFHPRRLVEALRAGWEEPAVSVLERLLRHAEAFRGHREPTDDVSVILLRRLGCAALPGMESGNTWVGPLRPAHRVKRNALPGSASSRSQRQDGGSDVRWQDRPGIEDAGKVGVVCDAVRVCS